MIRLDAIQLIGNFCETLLFGVYAILFGWNVSIIFMRARVRRPDGRHRYPVNKVMLAVITLQAAFITLHWTIGVIKTYAAFITHNTSPLGPLIYYAQANNVLSVVGLAAFLGAEAALSTLLIYRMYLACDAKFYMTILPTMSNIVFVAGSIYVSYRLSHLTSWADLTKSGSWVQVWYIVLFSLAFFVEASTAAMITYKILNNSRRLKGVGSHSALLPIVRILGESAFVSLVVSLALLILCVKGSSYAFLLHHIACPTSGIAYALIPIRSGQGVFGRTTEGSADTSSSWRAGGREPRGEDTVITFAPPHGLIGTKRGGVVGREFATLDIGVEDYRSVARRNSLRTTETQVSVGI